MNKTLDYVVVEILSNICIRILVPSIYKDEQVPFLYIWPSARVISRRVAVPLVGSMTPKLQASLQNERISI
jgi:hypothetical protein